MVDRSGTTENLLRLEELPHWAIDQLEEHYPDFVNDETTVPVILSKPEIYGDGSRVEQYYVLSIRYRINIQLREGLPRPVVLVPPDFEKVLAGPDYIGPSSAL